MIIYSLILYFWDFCLELQVASLLYKEKQRNMKRDVGMECCISIVMRDVFSTFWYPMKI